MLNWRLTFAIADESRNIFHLINQRSRGSRRLCGVFVCAHSHKHTRARTEKFYSSTYAHGMCMLNIFAFRI